MTNITDFPNILEPVPKGITKFAFRDAARTMVALRNPGENVEKDVRSAEEDMNVRQKIGKR